MGTLHLITGDIIENCIDMDAIVNAQNKYMQMGSGVCGAIYNAAGIELLNYCQNNYKEYMIDGEVRITPGFNLKCNIVHVFIVHTRLRFSFLKMFFEVTVSCLQSMSKIKTVS